MQGYLEEQFPQYVESTEASAATEARWSFRQPISVEAEMPCVYCWQIVAVSSPKQAVEVHSG